MRPLDRPDRFAPPRNVVPFPALRGNGFTVRDRIDALEWQATRAAQASGLARLDFHAGHPGDGHETCDLLLLYRRDARFARWGAARRAGRVGVWRCADGIDLGRFETMRQALDALLQADGPTPHPASRLARNARLSTPGQARTA